MFLLGNVAIASGPGTCWASESIDSVAARSAILRHHLSSPELTDGAVSDIVSQGRETGTSEALAGMERQIAHHNRCMAHLHGRIFDASRLAFGRDDGSGDVPHGLKARNGMARAEARGS